MGTDWFVNVKCRSPKTDVSSREELVKQCSHCPYVIWEGPESVAGFMSSMCGVRVGSICIAAELDDIGEAITGIQRFTKEEGSASAKLRVLWQIKAYAERDHWSIEGFSKKRTLRHLDSLIEFCRRAEKKGLDIWAWA